MGQRNDFYLLPTGNLVSRSALCRRYLACFQHQPLLRSANLDSSASNLPFNEWTEVFGSERLTGALLDRLTHHVHILEMNGESFRLTQSKKKRAHSSD